MTKPNTFTISRTIDGFTAHGFAKYQPAFDNWEVTVTSGFGTKQKRQTTNVWMEFEDMIELAIEADREKLNNVPDSPSLSDRFDHAAEGNR